MDLWLGELCSGKCALCKLIVVGVERMTANALPVQLCVLGIDDVGDYGVGEWKVKEG